MDDVGQDVGDDHNVAVYIGVLSHKFFVMVRADVLVSIIYHKWSLEQIRHAQALILINCDAACDKGAEFLREIFPSRFAKVE